MAAANGLRTGVYPGTFDPPTVAHLHVAEVAMTQLDLARIDLSLSIHTLGKDDATLTPVDERVRHLHDLTAGRPWLGVRTTPASLLADVADGYDVVVVGADKWHQLLDPSWHPSVEHHVAALARLPVVAVAPRPPWPLPSPSPDADADADANPALGALSVVVLDTDPAHHPVSSTAVRAGRQAWRAQPRAPQ